MCFCLKKEPSKLECNYFWWFAEKYWQSEKKISKKRSIFIYISKKKQCIETKIHRQISQKYIMSAWRRSTTYLAEKPIKYLEAVIKKISHNNQDYFHCWALLGQSGFSRMRGIMLELWGLVTLERKRLEGIVHILRNWKIL